MTVSEIARRRAPALLPQSTVNTVKLGRRNSATTTVLTSLHGMQWKSASGFYDPAKGEPSQDVAPQNAVERSPDNFLCPECKFSGKDCPKNYIEANE